MARKPITFDNIGEMTVDEVTGQLFWKGEAVAMKQRISLRPFELCLAFLGAAGALLSGIHPFGVTLGWW